MCSFICAHTEKLPPEEADMGVTIAGIAGSLRADSRSRALLRVAGRHLPPDVRLTIWDGLASVPPFNEDLEAGPAPAGVAPLPRLINAADAPLRAPPQHTSSSPRPLTHPRAHA